MESKSPYHSFLQVAINDQKKTWPIEERINQLYDKLLVSIVGLSIAGLTLIISNYNNIPGGSLEKELLKIFNTNKSVKPIKVIKYNISKKMNKYVF